MAPHAWHTPRTAAGSELSHRDAAATRLLRVLAPDARLGAEPLRIARAQLGEVGLGDVRERQVERRREGRDAPERGAQLLRQALAVERAPDIDRLAHVPQHL